MADKPTIGQFISSPRPFGTDQELETPFPPYGAPKDLFLQPKDAGTASAPLMLGTLLTKAIVKVPPSMSGQDPFLLKFSKDMLTRHSDSVALDVSSKTGISNFNPLRQAKLANPAGFLVTHPHSTSTNDSHSFTGQLVKVDKQIFDFLTTLSIDPALNKSHPSNFEGSKFFSELRGDNGSPRIMDPRSQSKDGASFERTHPHSAGDQSAGSYPDRYSAQLLLDNKDREAQRNFLKNAGQGGEVFDFNFDPGRMHAGTAQGTGFGGQGMQALNPRLYAKQLVMIGKSLSANASPLDRDQQVKRLATFVAQNILLHSMNRHGRIWNPLTIAPPPVAGMFMTNTIDSLSGTPQLLTGYDDSQGPGTITSSPGFYERNHGRDSGNRGGDIHATIAAGNYNEIQISSVPPFVSVAKNVGAMGPIGLLNKLTPSLVGAPSQATSMMEDTLGVTEVAPLTPIVDAALATRNTFNPGGVSSVNVNVHDLASGAPFTIGALVKEALSQTREAFPLLKIDDKTDLKRFDINQVFSKTRVSLGGYEWMPKKTFGGKPLGWKKYNEQELEKNFYPSGIVPAGFKSANADDNKTGFIETTLSETPSEAIKDDEAYVPLSFTDLRPYSGNKLRTIYFRPFITNITEEFNPEWNRQSYFGRVDPVMTYQSTARSVQLGFIVHAFAPEDLKLIYKKLNWLASMVYPEYDANLLYKSGPVVRMRIGDLISSSKGGKSSGVAGVIDNLSFEYTDAIWELTKGSKVPMGYRVSMGFTVLHDTPIGRGDEGKFGGIGTINDSGKFEAPKGGTSDTLSPDVGDGAGLFRTAGNQKE